MKSILKIGFLLSIYFITVFGLPYTAVSENLLFLISAVCLAILFDGVISGYKSAINVFLFLVFVPLPLWGGMYLLLSTFGWVSEGAIYIPFYFVFAIILARPVMSFIKFDDLLNLPVSIESHRSLVLAKVLFTLGSESLREMSMHLKLLHRQPENSLFHPLKRVNQAFAHRFAAFLSLFVWLFGKADDIAVLIENRKVGEKDRA